MPGISLLRVCLLLAGALSIRATDEGNVGWSAASRARNKDEAAQYSQGFLLLNGNEDPQLVEWWGTFKQHYYKTYASDAEERKAFEQFQKNIADVAQINANPDIPFWITNNYYADMTLQERAERSLTVVIDPNGPVLGGLEPRLRSLKTLPVDDLELAARRHLLQISPNVDWRTPDKVSPIRDQGSCGSCWAFSATASLESAYLISQGQTSVASKLDLSEQQLVDCATSAAGYYSSGCGGGCAECALRYAFNKYMTTESFYPYSARAGTCRAPSSPPLYQAVRPNADPWFPDRSSEATIMAAVTKQPIVIYFAVVNDFFSYSGGIYTGASCGNTGVNHGMVAVGYHYTGSSSSSYWIIRNSWGAWWGMNGYAQVAMDGSRYGVCKMYTYASAPPLSFALTMNPPTPTPSPVPPSPKPSPLPSPTPSPLPSPRPSPLPSPKPSPLPSPPPSPKPSPLPSPVPSPKPSPLPPPPPSPLPSPPPSPKPSPLPSPKPSPVPSPQPSPVPSPTPSPQPPSGCTDTYAKCNLFSQYCAPQYWFGQPIYQPVRSVCKKTCNACAVADTLPSTPVQYVQLA